MHACMVITLKLRSHRCKIFLETLLSHCTLDQKRSPDQNSTLDRVGRVEDPIYKSTGQDISMTHILSATNLKLWGKLLDYFI